MKDSITKALFAILMATASLVALLHGVALASEIENYALTATDGCKHFAGQTQVTVQDQQYVAIFPRPSAQVMALNRAKMVLVEDSDGTVLGPGEWVINGSGIICVIREVHLAEKYGEVMDEALNKQIMVILAAIAAYATAAIVVAKNPNAVNDTGFLITSLFLAVALMASLIMVHIAGGLAGRALLLLDNK